MNNKHKLIATALCSALATTAVTANTAYAQSTITDASMASGMSAAVPVAVVGLSATAAITGASVITVKAIQLTANGTMVVVETLVEGVSQVTHFTVDAASGFAVGAGTVLSAASIAGGVLLYEGSRAVAMLPNAYGHTLMHHERLTY